MTKLCTTSFDLPDDELARKRFQLDLDLELAYCVLDEKIKPYNIKRINHNTCSREWRDQESVDKFYEFFYGLFPKYGGKLHFVKIVDI